MAHRMISGIKNDVHMGLLVLTCLACILPSLNLVSVGFGTAGLVSQAVF